MNFNFLNEILLMNLLTNRMNLAAESIVPGCVLHTSSFKTMFGHDLEADPPHNIRMLPEADMISAGMEFGIIAEKLHAADDIEGLEGAEAAALQIAATSDAAAVTIFSSFFSMAAEGSPAAMIYIGEMGTCPNDNDDCSINKFADAIYFLAAEACERLGVTMPNLGIEKHRWSSRKEIDAYVLSQKGLAAKWAILQRIEKALDNPPPDDGEGFWN